MLTSVNPLIISLLSRTAGNSKKSFFLVSVLAVIMSLLQVPSVAAFSSSNSWDNSRSKSLGSGASSSGKLSHDPIIREIISLDHEKKKMASQPGQGKDDLSGNDARYLRYLDSRIRELCARAVSEHGKAFIASLPCPPPDSMLPGYETPVLPSTSQRIRSADRELVESLGKFDEFLEGEQKKAAADRPRDTEAVYAGGGRATGGADSGGGGEYQNGSGADSGTGGQQGGEESVQKTASGAGGEQGQQGAVGREGAQTPGRRVAQNGSERKGTGSGDGHYGTQQAGTGQRGISGQGSRGASDQGAAKSIYEDDDIVARQLREAAERETDPELKKKLWEEYWKYKEENR